MPVFVWALGSLAFLLAVLVGSTSAAPVKTRYGFNIASRCRQEDDRRNRKRVGSAYTWLAKLNFNDVRRPTSHIVSPTNPPFNSSEANSSTHSSALQHLPCYRRRPVTIRFRMMFSHDDNSATNSSRWQWRRNSRNKSTDPLPYLPSPSLIIHRSSRSTSSSSTSRLVSLVTD